MSFQCTTYFDIFSSSKTVTPSIHLLLHCPPTQTAQSGSTSGKSRESPAWLRGGREGLGYLAGPGPPRPCTTAAGASAAPSACSTQGWGGGWCWGLGGPPLPSRLCPLPWPWPWGSRCAGFHSTSALKSGQNQQSGRSGWWVGVGGVQLLLADTRSRLVCVAGTKMTHSCGPAF